MSGTFRYQKQKCQTVYLGENPSTGLQNVLSSLITECRLWEQNCDPIRPELGLDSMSGWLVGGLTADSPCFPPAQLQLGIMRMDLWIEDVETSPDMLE